MEKACYRELHRYKYQLIAPYSLKSGIEKYEVDLPYIGLSINGMLTIKTGYAWDGPSGPTLDTRDFMRGSLVHDALYQLIRMGSIPYSFREHADRLLRLICREDGMCRFRAWYVYCAVRLCGGASARPGGGDPDAFICVP